MPKKVKTLKWFSKIRCSSFTFSDDHQTKDSKFKEVFEFRAFSLIIATERETGLSADWVYFAPFQTDTQVTVVLCWALFDLTTPILFMLSFRLDTALHYACSYEFEHSGIQKCVPLLVSVRCVNCSLSNWYVPVFKLLWATLMRPQRSKQDCLQIEFIHTHTYMVCVCVCVYTAISKKVVIVNSQYWNRKELWVQAAQIIYYC